VHSPHCQSRTEAAGNGLRIFRPEMRIAEGIEDCTGYTRNIESKISCVLAAMSTSSP
jgi:hypothetical protein